MDTQITNHRLGEITFSNADVVIKPGKNRVTQAFYAQMLKVEPMLKVYEENGLISIESIPSLAASSPATEPAPEPAPELGKGKGK